MIGDSEETIWLLRENEAIIFLESDAQLYSSNNLSCEDRPHSNQFKANILCAIFFPSRIA